MADLLLRAVKRLPPPAGAVDCFPFSVPAVRALERLPFSTPVTFFVGENGSGKSTMLEAIALAASLPVAGSEEGALDPTLAALRPLARSLRLEWPRRPRTGFFMRAEDFFGFAKRLNQMRAHLSEALDEVDSRYAGRSELAKGLARMPHARELHELRSRYGEGLDAHSHGENFLAFFAARAHPGGLYLLDEPEAPLSPAPQLALLALFSQLARQGSQFIVATHSPILMALPGATLLSFDEPSPRPVAWESLEHVRLMRDFLNEPAQYLQHL